MRVGPVRTGYAGEGANRTKKRNQSNDWLRFGRGGVGLNNLLVFALAVTQAVQEAQVDQDIDERVLIRDGLAVAEMRTFDTQGERL